MENERFWMGVDALREKAVEGAQKVSKAAGAAIDTVRENIGVSVTFGETYQDYCDSAEYLRDTVFEDDDFAPEVLLILGSGLGFMADEVENPMVADFEDIPGFSCPTAPGHAGRLVFGTLCGKRVMVMQGRLHAYEGYTMREIVYPVRVAKVLGAKKLIVTNAAGAIREEFAPGDFAPGDIMLLRDHIKLFGDSPLTGANIDELGPRFPDMTHAYSPALQEVARESAQELGLTLREGVYLYLPGPQFETPAEIRAARILGADAVGMSTVPEVIAANHCGMEVLGFSLCTNMAAGILDAPLSEEDVLAAAEGAKENFSALVRKCLEKM
jgi:purine-nucleoside phosphorylase